MKTKKNINTKKIISLSVGLVLLIGITFCVLFGIYKPTGAKTIANSEYILQQLTTEKVEINNEYFEIYGNGTLTDKEFRDTVYEGSPKIYLHYRTDRNVNLPYDALLQVKTATKTYTYEFVEKEARDANFILNGIKSFINRYSTVLNSAIFNREYNVNIMSANDVPTTFIDCVAEQEYVMRFSDKGYLVYHIAVSEYKVDSESILYIVTVRNSFTPGIVALQNGETGYDSYKNYRGYAHIAVDRAYDAREEEFYGRRWGNIPYKKDYWPLNQPSDITITSSVQQGKTLGYSLKGGFSASGPNIGGEVSSQYNISYVYTKAVTSDEPIFSAQVNSSDTKICEWNYKYKIVAEQTYHLNTNYMFEIRNSWAGMEIGDFRLKLDYSFSVYNKEIITNMASVDLIVRPAYYRIYDFCSGMI